MSVRLTMFITLCAVGVLASSGLGDETQQGDLLVPYEPTHPQVVEAMLKLANVTNQDYVIDLGCGDGRIVIAAAKQFGARGFGVDLDPQRIREARDNATHEGVADRVRFEVADIMVTDIREANVVTLYLLNSVNLMVRPKLFSELEPGTRVVSHSFNMADWEADTILRHPKARGRILYFWIMPAPVGGAWRWTTKTSSAEIPCSLELEQEFQGLSGTLTLPGAGQVPITNVSITGKELAFTATVPIEGRQEEIAYRGTAEGDVIRGTQQWRSGPLAGNHPWTARRDPIDLTGSWKIETPSRADVDGTMHVARKDGKLIATYVRDKDQSSIPLEGFYVWGSSVRFEIPTADNLLLFTGCLEGKAGQGTFIGEGWSTERRWSARRVVGGKPSSTTRPTSRPPATQPRAGQTRRWNPQTGTPLPGDEYLNETDGSVLVWIPGGEFTMGSDDGQEDERPAHKVRVEGFWLGRYEVTNRQCARYIEAEEADPPLFWGEEAYNQPDQPVVGVTWVRARAYCEWAGLRLPTEAEWEYAAAGGKQLTYPTSTGEISHHLANTRGAQGADRWKLTSPAGSFPPNPFGLYDMAGNAWEWTSSTFAPYPYAPTEDREDTRALRVLRGGSWYFPVDYCRTTHRHRFASHLRYDYAGIRVALSGVAPAPQTTTPADR